MKKVLDLLVPAKMTVSATGKYSFDHCFKQSKDRVSVDWEWFKRNISSDRKEESPSGTVHYFELQTESSAKGRVLYVPEVIESISLSLPKIGDELLHAGYGYRTPDESSKGFIGELIGNRRDHGITSRAFNLCEMTYSLPQVEEVIERTDKEQPDLLSRTNVNYFFPNWQIWGYTFLVCVKKNSSRESSPWNVSLIRLDGPHSAESCRSGDRYFLKLP
jgi:hypothetical protein